VHGVEAKSVLAKIPGMINELMGFSSAAETIFDGRVRPEETEPLPSEFFKIRRT
jgi:hypothetical protein